MGDIDCRLRGQVDREPPTCLAVYGTLAPGQPNHSQMEGLVGEWEEGFVRGRLFGDGWGAALGYPGLRLDQAGGIVAVWLFRSEDLPKHWDRLDHFEGPEYRRVLTKVFVGSGTVESFIYVLA